MKTSHRPRGNKKEPIIEAAARVFSRSGYANAAVADIALQANVGKGTVYEYFKSKEDLFFAVFEWFQKKTEKAAAVGIAALGSSAADRLRILNDSLMGQWDELKDVFVLVMEFWAASSSTQMRQRFRAAFKQLYVDYRQIVSALIRDGINSGEFRSDINPVPVAAALVGTWDALFLQAWFDDEFDPAATANDFLDALLRGLAA
ncbi:MAG: TetR/AcrR family transcriptional regulator [Deltaproteobacteria bacterium]|nr:TetR/AcrR family transcriptional regulator [Deltaproteobacteria bacterium]